MVRSPIGTAKQHCDIEQDNGGYIKQRTHSDLHINDCPQGPQIGTTSITDGNQNPNSELQVISENTVGGDTGPTQAREVLDNSQQTGIKQVSASTFGAANPQSRCNTVFRVNDDDVSREVLDNSQQTGIKQVNACTFGAANPQSICTTVFRVNNDDVSREVLDNSQQTGIKQVNASTFGATNPQSMSTTVFRVNDDDGSREALDNSQQTGTKQVNASPFSATNPQSISATVFGVNDDDVSCVMGDDNACNVGEVSLTWDDVDLQSIQCNNANLKRIFDVVASTALPNYRAARVPLPSAMNVNSWRSELKGYSDYKIVDFIEFGWPVGFDRDATLRSQDSNHATATAHPRDITHYVATELNKGALLGPFQGPPANSCHFSPLLTRPKKDSRFRRVILDLSWPQGFSVNDGISKTDYVDGPMTISLPTPDDMERDIVRVGRGAFLYKTDLSRGYRQLRVDPLDWPLLSFRHEGNCFMDICPPFGLRSSAMAMQRVSQAIVHLHSRRGYASRAYIDDFGGAEAKQDRAARALAALQAVMDTLGVAQAEKKICPPTQCMVWLGIRFDTLAMTMDIPPAKMTEVMTCMREWSNRTRATRREIQSLLGLLNFVASVAPPARLFTNRLLDGLRESPPAGASSLSHQFKQDVNFFVELLPIFNGRRIMGKKIVPYQHQVELDACLTGCGAVAGDQFYSTQFPDHVLACDHTIAHLEMLNVVVAIKVWKKSWSGWTVQIFCDNLNSVYALQTGKSRDSFMRSCAREVFLYTAACDIDIQVCHRPGVEMIWADALSREHSSERYAAQVRNDPHLQSATRLTVPDAFFDIKNAL